ncbi:ABC transporter permease subunit [Bacillus sp. BRMEA1]|uniref:ABC transporter permease subunit n=1 Tax=Neobacillus endophyticus TaxID=2738405 RepID=UPI001566B7D0|nr:ABC transporter permease subunit [Neobacillus endophyticus]NRD80812.1 ABC transporter permease subunit [Neobacillus endophyticus]
MKTIFRLVIRLVLIISGFLYTFNLPHLFGIENDKIKISFQVFGRLVMKELFAFVQLKDPNYLVPLKELPIVESYQYTMTILAASLLVVLFLAMLIAVFVMLSSGKVQTYLKYGINFIEGVPDLLVIFLFQIFVIALYKNTGLRIFQLYGIFGAKPYFIPVVTVSFLPVFLLAQFLIKVMAEEHNQLYVLYLKAKGISMIRILLVHIFRNIFPLLLLQMRTIIWLILANIYLIEYMFNLNGFTKVIQRIIDFPSLVICLFMMAIPFVVVEAGCWLLIKRLNRKETVSL